MSSVIEDFKASFDLTKSETMTLTEYLDLCKSDKLVYCTAAERMLAAIGEPKFVDTSRDERLSKLFGNRIIRTYESFSDFYGMEDTIEQIVDYYKHSAQGLEESKQILYFLGPVGGGKSSLVERQKELMEKFPIYVLSFEEEDKTVTMSPYFSRVLPLFNRPGIADTISKSYNIDKRYISGIVGPWEMKRLEEAGGDLTRFRVTKVLPSRLKQIAISNIEPGDENTQDVSTLIGKVDIRKLEDYSQNDPDAYLYSGGLNISNQGIADFREMFKAKIKMLNPLLFAVQEHNYSGTEQLGAIPYDGIVIAHSNEAEWTKFRNNKDNEAFLDRIFIVKVPYCLRTAEEILIYKKSLQGSELTNAVIAPGTLEMMAQMSILSRIHEPDNSSIFSKMESYNGDNMKIKDPRVKAYYEYKDDPDNRDEGFFGISTRWAFKRLSQCFNADPQETAANPVHLMRILLDEIKKSDLPKETEDAYRGFVNDELKPKYFEELEKEIRTAYMESYREYGQNLFDNYVTKAMRWVEEEDYFNADTGEQLDRPMLNNELEKIEKAADIVNAKDFRNEVVRYVLRYAKDNKGNNPDWRSYAKLKEVIEKKMFSQTADILPIISFAPKGTLEDEKKHTDFIARMEERGYTKRQVKILVEWYTKYQKTM